jgi:hypothetical protein
MHRLNDSNIDNRVLNANVRPCNVRDSSLEDYDNFKLVRSNITDLYEKALKTGELSAISSAASRDRGLNVGR